MTETKKCRLCGEVKPLDEFSVAKDIKSGRKATCKPCTNAAQDRADARRAAEYKRRVEAEAMARTEAARIARGEALPRTFNHIKSPDVWTGHTERFFVRNDGNKNVPSKGVV